MYLQREEEASLQRMLDWKEALALIGPRRSGKTTLAERLLDNWKSEGGKGEYLDLEALNAPRTAAELDSRMEAAPEKSLVVLDEVQAVEGWVRVVRQQIERGGRHLIITGSSASLLSKEIASSLAGRAVPETVLPLSFRDARRWGISSLQQYLEIGGYPECVLRPNDAARLHKLYLELTVLRDVAARKGLREIKPLSDLALILLSEAGKTVSANKTATMLGISQPTFRSFVDALQDAFLILSVAPYTRSPRERLVADAKHYAVDTGLQNSVSVSTEEDLGRRVENVVAIELVRRGYSLSYLKFDGGECDFIAQKAGKPSIAVQVWSGRGSIPEREYEGLSEAIRTAGAEGLLLTLNRVSTKEKDVRTSTVEDWLLER